MRRLLVLLCLLPAACTPAVSTAPVPRPELAGTLQGDTVLQGEVELTGDLRIPVGSRLLIEPGTTLWIRPAESTKMDPEYLSGLTEILVEGELRIRGTAAAPVRFRTLASIDPVADTDPLWAGIELIGGRALLEHLQLERAETGLLVQGGEAEVRQSRFDTCRTGLATQTGGSLTLEASRIEGGETGLFCWPGSSLSLSGSLIAEHDEEGLYLAEGCTFSAGDTLLQHNDRGLVAAEAVASGLRFRDNRRDFQPLQNRGQR